MKLSFLSLLLLLAVLTLIGFYIKRGKSLTVTAMNMKILQWFFAVYSVVLLLSVAVLYLLPQDGFAASTNTEALPDIHYAARIGKLDQMPGVFAKSNWSFDYQAAQLEIAADPNLLLWAQRKDTDNGKLEVVYYLAKSSLDGVDYTDKIKPPAVGLTGNRLTVTGPSPYQINLARFSKDFTVSQFSGEGLVQRAIGPSGQAVLFLRIPNNLNIDNAQKRIEFVGK